VWPKQRDPRRRPSAQPSAEEEEEEGQKEEEEEEQEGALQGGGRNDILLQMLTSFSRALHIFFMENHYRNIQGGVRIQNDFNVQG
jgi:hypothetical protein